MRLRKLATLIVLVTGCHAAETAREASDGASAERGDFLSRAQAHVAAREYWASPTEAGLQAPNREHGLRTYFEPTGVRVHDRASAGSPRLVELRLARAGRGDALELVPPGEVTHREGRVEIRRDDLVEWYENSPQGLEQGFTLGERLGAQLEGELVLELAVAGARASRRGEDIALSSEAGRKLKYGKLAVADATGRALAARFDVPAPDRVRLVVDDASADYPIVIDPLLEGAPDTQLESDQAGGLLGTSAASAGDVNGDGFADVIVGATGYDTGQGDGIAAVFLGSASGIADGGPASANFLLQTGAFMGGSVASAGDVNGDGYDDVIVGAFDRAFLYLGSASGIVGAPSTPHATLEPDQASSIWGNSVASAGDVNGDGYDDVIVGAPNYDAGHDNEGAAFVFLGSASGIASGNATTAHAQLEADQDGAIFGASVASAGDVNGDSYGDVIVGARSYDAGQTNEGAAFVFLGSASGVADGNPSTAHAQLESDQANAGSASTVASAGDVNGDGYADVLLGFSSYPGGGAVFVFHGSASGISDGNPAAADTHLDGTQTGFGNYVNSAGDVNGDGYTDVIVSATRWEDGLSDDVIAFVFTGSASGIADGAPGNCYASFKIDDQDNVGLGASVASAGDVNGDGYDDVIVGSRNFDAGQADEGGAFVLLGSATGLTDGQPSSPAIQLAATQLESDQVDSSLGASVASADVNGDGYADVIVGAPEYDAGHSNEGAAFVFLGTASGIADGGASTAAAQLESDQAGALLGGSVASAGDVNGDGYADVIVGAHLYDAGQTNAGAAFVFLGSASGVADGNPASAHARLESDQSGALFGRSVASAGDVNGDGYADVIVGAHLYDAGEADEGAAFVFLGSPAGVADGSPATAHAQLESDQAGANLGWSLATAGDVNGDGYADVIVGARSYDAAQSNGGAAFVFLGAASGIGDGTPSSAHVQLESDQANSGFGASVATAGDVNGDGYADVIVGADLYDTFDGAVLNGGAAFVFVGSATGVTGTGPATAHAELEGNNGAGPIHRVASAGDVNGDGYAEVIVSGPNHAVGGAAFVFFGSAAGIADDWVGTADAQLENNQNASGFGSQVAAGDVNGDGYSDVIVGAPSFDADLANEGAAFVFLGNSQRRPISPPFVGNPPGRPVLARQRSSVHAGGEPVQAWGGARHFTSFQVELRASHPAGVGRVRTEIEACPTGVPFGDAGCTSTQSSGWTLLSSGTAEAVIATDVSGLDPEMLYRWRARVLRADSTGPLPANPTHGPWRRPGAQATEADIRTVPEPGAVTSLAACAALLALLERRRSRAYSP